MERIMLAGLVKLELPGHTVLLCDGGTLTFAGEVYSSIDPLFGTIASIEPFAEGVGDAAPASTIAFAPPEGSDVAAIFDAAQQGSRLRMWVAEVDADTGLIIGTPDQEIDAVVDVPWLSVGRGSRTLEFDFVSSLERVFIVNRGNVLSGEFHQRIYPGERGLDNATGVSGTFAWGVAGPPRGVSGSAAGSGGGGLRSIFAATVNAW